MRERNTNEKGMKYREGMKKEMRKLNVKYTKRSFKRTPSLHSLKSSWNMCFKKEREFCKKERMFLKKVWESMLWKMYFPVYHSIQKLKRR